MGRHRSHRALGVVETRATLFIPNYDQTWVEYDENNPTKDCDIKHWSDAWEREEGRDFVHRINSKYMARYLPEDYKPGDSKGYSTMAIVICFIILGCVIVPQIIKIIYALFVRKKRRANKGLTSVQTSPMEEMTNITKIKKKLRKLFCKPKKKQRRRSISNRKIKFDINSDDENND